MGFLVFLALLAYFNSMSRCCLLKCTLRRFQAPLAFEFGGKERGNRERGRLWEACGQEEWERFNRIKN